MEDAEQIQEPDLALMVMRTGGKNLEAKVSKR